MEKFDQLKMFNTLLHGGDYNPDQWLDHPEVLKEDIELMKKAHINCVSLAIFAWAKLEPEENVYDFKWLKDIIDNLYANGIYTLLATPSGAMPAWLATKYPECLEVNEQGLRRYYGERHNFCHSSPIYQEKVKAIDEKLSQCFGKHPGVIAWHISNEFGGDDQDSQCHCELCQIAFRKWLKDKYQTLDNLNHAWWNNFWSHTITDWDQIHSPSMQGEHELHGLKLDWKRFTSYQKLQFAKMEIQAVKKYSDLPVTTNMMTFFKPLDYYQWGKEFDFVSWDSYPEWHLEEDELSVASRNACFHQLIRSIKKAPFLLMESTPSMVNWKPINTLKRPNMHELSSLQAVACGSNSVQYFQWRKGRGSSEKFHGAVVDHRNHDNTRVFNDVKKLGERLVNTSDQIIGTINKPEVCMIYDWDNRWALEDVQGLERGNINYDLLFNHYYRPLWDMGIDTDIVDMTYDLDDYKVVIAPFNYMYKPGYADKVRKFVKNGGIYITNCFSGEVDENDLCFMDHHPLSDVLGINTEEIDTVDVRYWPNEIEFDDHSFNVKNIRALIHTTTAKVLASYKQDFYQGYPALTVNEYGQGKAYFIASHNDLDFLSYLYQKILKQANITNHFDAKLTLGVTINTRKDQEKELFFVQNFNRNKAEIYLNSSYENIETKQILQHQVTLEPFECMILKKTK